MEESKGAIRRFFSSGSLHTSMDNEKASLEVMVYANSLRIGVLGLLGALAQGVNLYSLMSHIIMQDPLMRWFSFASVIGLVIFGLFFLRQDAKRPAISMLWPCQAAFVLFYIVVDLIILFISRQMQVSTLLMLPVVLLGILVLMPGVMRVVLFTIYMVFILLFAGNPLVMVQGLIAVLAAYFLSWMQHRVHMERFILTLDVEKSERENAELKRRIDKMTVWDDQLQMNSLRAMSTWLEAVWPLCVRNKIPVAAIVISPDGMENVRNAKGQDIALKRLLQCAQALKPFVRRQSDFLGRYENDKFVILFSGLAKEDAYLLAKRITEQCRKQNWKDDEHTPITLYMGIYYGLPRENMVAAQWITKADDALERVKAQGKDAILIEQE